MQRCALNRCGKFSLESEKEDQGKTLLREREREREREKREKRVVPCYLFSWEKSDPSILV